MDNYAKGKQVDRWEYCRTKASQWVANFLGAIRKDMQETLHHNFGLSGKGWLSRFNSAITCVQSRPHDGAACFNEVKTPSYTL